MRKKQISIFFRHNFEAKTGDIPRLNKLGREGSEKLVGYFGISIIIEIAFSLVSTNTIQISKLDD